MICRVTFSCAFICLLIIVVSLNVKAQQKKEGVEFDKHISSFRYVIADNYIDPSTGQNDETRRFVEVLMDKKSFSKENLITLFQLVSKRFTKPGVLYVNVFTDLEDIETPEERDMPKTSDTHYSGSNQQDTATFTRYNKKMNFIINFANGNSQEVEVK